MATSAERALAGSEQAAIRNRVLGDLKDGMKLSSFDWHKTIAEAEVGGYREVILNIIDSPKETSFRINGQTYDHNRIDAVLPLGKAEEWRAISLVEDHPIHIHVNPFQIVSIEDPEGRDATDPKSPAFDPDYAGLKGEWMDTVLLKKDMRVAFRTRYERFTGDFVMHCHIMYHGDHGMMQNLRIAAEGEAMAAHAMH
jgi:FtsP/CotA-like multicopper oxidase with cupredoxin domain